MHLRWRILQVSLRERIKRINYQPFLQWTAPPDSVKAIIHPLNPRNCKPVEFWLSWYWIFSCGSLESSAFRSLDKPKGKRTQNTFCPHPHTAQLPPKLHSRDDLQKTAVGHLFNTKTSYKTGVCRVYRSCPSNRLRQLAIYHSSGPWQSALKSFRQDARGHKPEKEKPTTPGTGLQPTRNPLHTRSQLPVTIKAK